MNSGAPIPIPTPYYTWRSFHKVYSTESFLVIVYQYQETSFSFLIGLGRYSKIGSISDKIFTLYYDHMGFIHKLTPDHFEAGGSPENFGNSKGIFGKVSDILHWNRLPCFKNRCHILNTE